MADGLNWYRYANNNPIMYRDPTGLMAQEGGGGSTAEEDNTDLDNLRQRRRDAEANLAEARRLTDNVMNATSDAERATAVQAALDFEAGLTNPQIYDMQALDEVFMDQVFREVLNLSTITGRDIAVDEVFDANGNILTKTVIDENGNTRQVPLWTILPAKESALHIPDKNSTNGYETLKLINEAGQEVVIQRAVGDPSNINKMRTLGSNWDRLNNISNDMNPYRGTFNYQNHMIGDIFHANSSWHNRLDIAPWWRHEGSKSEFGRYWQIVWALKGLTLTY